MFYFIILTDSDIIFLLKRLICLSFSLFRFQVKKIFTESTALTTNAKIERMRKVTSISSFPSCSTGLFVGPFVGQSLEQANVPGILH